MCRNQQTTLPVQLLDNIILLAKRATLLLIQVLLRPFRGNCQIRLQQKIFQAVQTVQLPPRPDFSMGLPLPEKYGRGLPERVIELLLAKMVYSPGAELLDVGNANAMKCHLQMIVSLPGPRYFTGIDIASPAYDVQKYYNKSIRSNIANTDFKSQTFDIIWCISALEHFGMDNSGYTSEFTMDSGLASRALQEMLRILKPGGRILITVPFGKYEDHGWLINYDTGHFHHLLQIVRPYGTIYELYFRHTFGSGWTNANPDELRYVGYFDQANSGAGALAAAIIEKHL
jgi:SAM-dependent methyltransferase